MYAVFFICTEFFNYLNATAWEHEHESCLFKLEGIDIYSHEIIFKSQLNTVSEYDIGSPKFLKIFLVTLICLNV